MRVPFTKKAPSGPKRQLTQQQHDDLGKRVEQEFDDLGKIIASLEKQGVNIGAKIKSGSITNLEQLHDLETQVALIGAAYVPLEDVAKRVESLGGYLTELSGIYEAIKADPAVYGSMKPVLNDYRVRLKKNIDLMEEEIGISVHALNVLTDVETGPRTMTQEQRERLDQIEERLKGLKKLAEHIEKEYIPPTGKYHGWNFKKWGEPKEVKWLKNRFDVMAVLGIVSLGAVVAGIVGNNGSSITGQAISSTAKAGSASLLLLAIASLAYLLLRRRRPRKSLNMTKTTIKKPKKAKPKPKKRKR